MKLSLILCSRNDEYMGNSRWRLESSVNYVAERVAAIDRSDDVEVIVADWGSAVPLRDVVRLGPAAQRMVRFVTVPPDLARAQQGDSPFPEVLALNAAARRARGDYIGRIDQDTLVGTRFLRWMFDTAEAAQVLNVPHVRPDAALFFANRRNIPYRFAAGSPSLQNVTWFVRLFGWRLSAWRKNSATGHLFWTSYVGIWLAHRKLWEECGGYDERLIYYNWMETDMICRLRRKYPLINLGEIVGDDFYHLEHYPPRKAWFSRPHEKKNAVIDPAATRPVMHPNSPTWGLAEYDLVPQPGGLAARSHGANGAKNAARALPDASALPIELVRFTAACLGVAVGTVADRIFIASVVQRDRWRHRTARVRQEWARQPEGQRLRGLLNLWAASGLRARLFRILGINHMRAACARWLAAAGVLGAIRRLRLGLVLRRDPEVRRLDAVDRERFVAFGGDYSAAIGRRLNDGSGQRALIVSSECPTVEGTLCIVKALQLAGFTVAVLLEDERKALAPFYELAGVEKVHLWSEFLTSLDCSREAATVVQQSASIDDVMRCSRGHVRVGMIAVCTALRRERVGELNLKAPGVRERVARYLATSMVATAEAQGILRTVKPDLVVTDPEYTPKGEFFDTCLEQGLDVVAYDNAHRTSALMLKRYRAANRDRHLTTLSDETWARLSRLDWTAERRDQLAGEVADTYRTGDWFGTPWPDGGQTHGRDTRSAGLQPCPPPTVDTVGEILGLDPTKKSAFIFPHMLWDAPVMWGKPLFSTYQDWFVETVKAACGNDRLNWVIKIHPAHVWKATADARPGEPAELQVIRERVGTLPPHVHILLPDAPVSTFSLFPVMNYCLTVRGTVGVEAARLGIPVLTAGPARYSELGFTIDSSNRAEYLDRLAHIDTLGPLSARQRELAERFAYGLFLLRPLRFTSVVWDPPEAGHSGHSAQRRARLTVDTEADWRRAADVQALAQWFVSRDEDFLNERIE